MNRSMQSASQGKSKGWKINPEYVKAKGVVILLYPSSPTIEDQIQCANETQEQLLKECPPQ